MKNVVVIGGGTGAFTVLSGLKKYSDKINISAIISMMDSGGSNRVIRDEFGLLPTSDIRQAIIALSSEKADEIIRELFTYRYSQGTGISGMTFGNLFMAALTDIYGSQEKAIEKTSKLLAVKGKIIPVTFDDVHLVASYDNGMQILGEHYIDEPNEIIGKAKITEIKTIPIASANPKALEEIKKADLIILGPGDLFTSTICNFVVKDIANSIKTSKAKIVYIMNLMTKFGQTTNFKASDHIVQIEKYIGRKVDYCLVNNKKLSKSHISWYEKFNSAVVKDDLDKINLKVIRRNFISEFVHKKHKDDKLFRSLVRHDANAIAKTILEIV